MFHKCASVGQTPGKAGWGKVGCKGRMTEGTDARMRVRERAYVGMYVRVYARYARNKNHKS